MTAPTPVTQLADELACNNPHARAEPPIGYRNPPPARRFRPGVSGNPMGRPRRVAVAPPAPRRLIPLEPTEFERAMAELVFCPALGGQAVSRGRAALAKLTEVGVVEGNVSALRELVRYSLEAESIAAERAQLLAELEDADARAEQARRQAGEKAARAAAEHANDAARMALEDIVDQAAEDAGEADTARADRALDLLDATDPDAAGDEPALKPWVVPAAQAHDPALPRGGDRRPLDLAKPWDALRRLDIIRDDEEDEAGLSAWFIDAARARRGEGVFTPDEEALLALVRVELEENNPDWVGRLERWEAMTSDPA